MELGRLDANINLDNAVGFTPRVLRDALGRFATGVAVVTTHPEGYNPMGLTVNSFASVSLDPPLVLWSLDRDSDTQGPFLASDHFAVNILRADQQDLSTRLATRGRHNLHDGEYVTWETGAPILTNTLAQFDCEVQDRLDGGDHLIFLGRVKRIASNEGAPLLFSQGAYGELRS